MHWHARMPEGRSAGFGAFPTQDKAKFPDVPKLIEEMAPTKLILWEHPILDVSSAGCAKIVTVAEKRVCVMPDGWRQSCCPAPAHLCVERHRV